MMARLLSSGEARWQKAREGPVLAAERRLMRRVATRCGAEIARACRYSSVPAAFLAALVANESGGNARAARFEPSVYNHLRALAEGRRPRFGGIRREALEAEVTDMLHPKAVSFHEVFFTDGSRSRLPEGLVGQYSLGQQGGHHTIDKITALGQGVQGRSLANPALAELADEALRELATSWGPTQIMGYHLVGRAGTVRDLLDPEFHFKLALTLLAEFSERYGLDLRLEFSELFRCWNTGRPYGETTDPRYVEKGLLRMEIFRALEEEERLKDEGSAARR
jgi:hypothetical protein